MSYEAIEVKPTTVNIGAEISGIDLGKPLSNKQVEELHTALMEHQVIFFRDQEMDHEAHQTLGRHFGELALHSAGYGMADNPYVVPIHADENSKFVAGENWHSDLTCNEIPPMGSILYMKVLPPAGGDTLWASMYAAYDALSDGMKKYLEPLQAVHDGEHVYRPLIDDPDRRFPTNTHPVIRTHPVTGRKAIFVNPSYTTEIVGVSKAESAGVLKMLYDHCMNPNFQVRFRWEPNSVAFWDNRCTWHFATWDYFPQVRSGFRVTVAENQRPA